MTRQLVFKPIDNFSVALLLNGEEQGTWDDGIAEIIRNVGEAYPNECELQLRNGGWTANHNAVKAAIEMAGIPSHEAGRAMAGEKIEF
jgi:hypothetical protein